MRSIISLLPLFSPFVSAVSNGIGLANVAIASGKLYFGTATDNPELPDTAYVDILTNRDEFRQLTPANSMKWDATEPEQGVFNFTGADQIVDIALSHGYLMRGHNLVGQWKLDEGYFNSSDAKPYSYGKIYAWDVVNEPWNGDGTLESTMFSEIIGDDYIAIALQAARAADPHVKFLRDDIRYINDFGIEVRLGPGEKASGAQALVKSLKSEGVPIDGIGFESHFIVNEIPANISQNMLAFNKLGVEVAVTELDIRYLVRSQEWVQLARGTKI
ncbi:hypothetical protein Clacol_002197 [Clathrus columnatus]|uniref:Beta-xylanase n=1 Tax=Clathrus columnatus TaxID=1419009 RepID=A0AAV5A7W0_9AGAM|nr:hypothetical protein Clacol_002197 [Clathrus columnatus]